MPSGQIGLDKKRFQSSCKGVALQRVKEDMQTADALNLDSTPSWLLCTPEGYIWHLSSLSQVKDMVK